MKNPSLIIACAIVVAGAVWLTGCGGCGGGRPEDQPKGKGEARDAPNPDDFKDDSSNGDG